MPLTELFAQVRAMGGRLVWRGGVVSVEAKAGVTPEMEMACQAHQTELVLLVPRPLAEGPPKKRTPYADANTWVKTVYQAGGKIVKDEEGTCTLSFPEGLDPAWTEALLEWSELFLPEACDDFMTEPEFMARLTSMRP